MVPEHRDDRGAAVRLPHLDVRTDRRQHRRGEHAGSQRHPGQQQLLQHVRVVRVVLDDLRVLALNNRKRVDVYFSQEAGQRIVSAFAYCFTAAPGSGYPPILNQNLMVAGTPVTIKGPGGDIQLLPFRQDHGDISSLGFRIGNFAYSCDLSGIPAESDNAVSDLDVWVLDALRPAPHPSHLSLSEAQDAVGRFRPAEAILTNLHIDLDYAETDRITPANVRPAYDGLKIDVTNGKPVSPR